MKIILCSILLCLLGFYVGKLYSLRKEQLFLVDLFCTFIRVYGLTWKEIEEEDYDINELGIPYLLNKFKVFLGTAIDRDTLNQIKEDLRKEGR